MIFPNFDPHMFSRLSQRERMVRQLQGAGYGTNGIANVIRTNGGHVSVLEAMNGLGAMAPRSLTSVMRPTADVRALAPMLTQTSLAPAATPSPTKFVADTTNSLKVIDSPSPSTHVQETDPNDGASTPDPSAAGGGYATGNDVNQGDVQYYGSGSGSGGGGGDTGSSNSYASGNDYTPGSPDYSQTNAGTPQPPTTAQAAQAVLDQAGQPSSGIPTWAWVVGGLAVGFAATRLLGKKR